MRGWFGKFYLGMGNNYWTRYSYFLKFWFTFPQLEKISNVWQMYVNVEINYKDSFFMYVPCNCAIESINVLYNSRITMYVSHISLYMYTRVFLKSSHWPKHLLRFPV
jgi:hypothetical protein